jgi:hypothetical protein
MTERERRRVKGVGIYDDPPTSDSDRSPSPEPLPSPKLEHIEVFSNGIRTRSKTHSLSPVKKAGQVLAASPVKGKLLPEVIPESKEDTQSVVSVEEEIGISEPGLGLNGMEVEAAGDEGEVPMPKPAKLDAESQAAIKAAAIADRKAAPRRRRKGDGKSSSRVRQLLTIDSRARNTGCSGSTKSSSCADRFVSPTYVEIGLTFQCTQRP